MSNQTSYTVKEERLNVLSHFIGLVLSVIALILLLIKSISTGDIWTIVSFSIYGLSLVILYLASTLYHRAKTPSTRRRLNVFDHAAIYILIAGTYTPYTLVSLHGKIGWIFFGIIWGIALWGVLFKLFFTGKFNKLSTLLYVLMGWIVIFVSKPLLENLSTPGLVWLAIGGLFYTIGAVLYIREKMRYNHAIFHIFVLLGSISHFISIYYYVQ